MAFVLAELVPQEFVAVTLKVPLVAVPLKEMLTELVLPVMVAPVPLYDHVYVLPATLGTV